MDTAMNSFDLLFEQWELAEGAALRAEACLSRQLDAWCDGIGAAPGLRDIAEARRLRAGAGELLRLLQSHLASERQGAPLL